MIGSSARPRRGLAIVMLTGLAACSPGLGPTGDVAPVPDTDSGDNPDVLPIDTSFFVPQDTGTDPAPPDVTPDHWINLRHFGTWNTGTGSFLTGDLTIREFIDEIDTGDTGDTSDTSDTAQPDPWLCEVVYALTGPAAKTHSCPTCDLVFDVEHVVQSGDPTECREPDAPADGAIWQMGFDSGADQILHNYFGTGLWLPWFDTITEPPTIAFEWSFTLAVELEDTGT